MAGRSSRLLGPLGHVARIRLGILLDDRRSVFFIAKFSRPDLDHLSERIEAGSLRPVIDRVYPIDEIVDPLTYLGEATPEARWQSPSEGSPPAAQEVGQTEGIEVIEVRGQARRSSGYRPGELLVSGGGKQRCLRSRRVCRVGQRVVACRQSHPSAVADTMAYSSSTVPTSTHLAASS